jgi:hypothetical protein
MPLASPYCASRTAASTFPLSHPSIETFLRRLAAGPKVVDAYDAYIQAQLLGKQEQELKRVRNEKKSGGGGRGSEGEDRSGAGRWGRRKQNKGGGNGQVEACL